MITHGTSRLWAHLLGQPLALHEPVLRSLVGVLERHERGERLADEQVAAVVAPARARREQRAGIMIDGEDAPQREPFVLNGSVACIPVQGAMMKYASWIEDVSPGSGVSSERIVDGLGKALASARVNKVCLVIDSPGGSVKGIDSIIDAIGRVKAKKPIVAYADDTCCSAAYLIASQCDAVYAGPGASVGSMGVYCVIEDTSAMYQDAGIARKVIRYGQYKGVGEDGVKVTESDVEVVQREIDALGEWLVSNVAAGRSDKLDIDSVRALATGEAWIGEDAKSRGLVDEITTLRALLSDLNAAA